MREAAGNRAAVYNRAMLRGSLSRWSFLCLVLTLELWVLSYFQVSYIRGGNVFTLAAGSLQWLHYGEGPAGRAGGWYWEGLDGLTTLRAPDFSSSPWGDWALSIPLWLPALVLAMVPCASFCSACRRRRRAKSGLCPECGYDLRGHRHDPPTDAQAIRCPECGAKGRSKP